jgi:prepilin-type N-terminal cleavage/methylation domain-containing protein
MMRPHSDRPGFTIIELLITMTLVSILAVIVWLRVEGMNARAYRASVISDLRSVALAQELYFQQHMEYGDVDDLTAYLPTEGVTVTMTYMSNQGYAATAAHSALPAMTCGFFAGTVPDGAASPAEEPGQTTCD